MEMDSNCGNRKLLHMDERAPASFHPTFEPFFRRPVIQMKGFYDHNNPKQLSTRYPKIDYSHPIPPILDIIHAYGSTANPTT